MAKKSSFNQIPDLTVLPMSKIVSVRNLIPAEPAVYLIFLRGGDQVLEASRYRGDLPLLRYRGRTHVYTGCAQNLRQRLTAHALADLSSSPVARALLALERQYKSISRSGTSWAEVQGEKSLALWLCANASVGYELHPYPRSRERELLRLFASPLNIQLRHRAPYAALLSALTQSIFPYDKPESRRAARRR